MIRHVKLRSLAKINLDLRVLHKRSDGYHELRTVFQTISLADSLEIEYEAVRKTELLIEDPLAIPDNLVLRAAKAVLDELGIRARVNFRLQKKIPMGGGLGGGSSNAAAVLLALPVLAGKAIPFGRLTDIATRLGSDIPFFLTGGTSLGIGRGTELYDLPDIRPEPLLLFCPGLHVSTPAAYQAMGRASVSDPSSLTDTELSSKINSFRAYVRLLEQERSAIGAAARSGNDFEDVVLQQYPPLKALAARVRKSGAAGWRMSGSGSTLFALYASRKAREEAQRNWKSGRTAKDCPIVAAELVSRTKYQSLWRRQLREYLGSETHTWPPQSSFAKSSYRT